MSETLEFPEIESAPRTEIATAAAAALDLTKIDLKDVALAQFGKWREKSAAARKTLTDVQHDLSTQAKIDDAKSLRHRLINVPLADARKVSKALKSKLNTVSGEVGAELVKIEADYAEVALLITPLIDAREAEIAEEKRIAAEKEAERIAGIQAQIDIIRGYLAKAQAPDMTSARIQKGVELVEAMEIGEAFAELKGAAEEAKRSTLAGMLNLRDMAKAREDEAARLEAQRQENERIAAEQKAEADRLAAERAEFERQKAELAAAQKAIDDAKAEAERKEREAQEAAALAEQMARLEREREAEEKAQREQVEARAAERAAVIEKGREIVNDIIAAEVLRDAVASTTNLIGFNDLKPASQEVTHAAPALIVAPARAIHPAAAALRNEQPTLKLGEICERLGFTVSAGFLADLGFEAHPERGAKLYRESEWMEICDAISEHVISRRDLVAA